MAAPKKKLPLHWKIIIGLVVGAILGVVANVVGSQVAPSSDPEATWLLRDADQNATIDGLDFLARDIADTIGKVFLRLILMVVVPLVVSALALGVVGIGDLRQLGRIGLRTLALTAVLSTIAVCLGVGLVNAIRPGHALDDTQREELNARYATSAADTVSKAKAAKSLKQTLLDLLPENPLQEMAGAVDGSSKGNGILAVMVFSLIIGVALTMVPQDKARPLVALFEAMFEVTMVVIRFAMAIAPFAVACLTFALVAQLGVSILMPLLGFAATVLVGLAIQLLLVYPLVISLFAKRSPREFFRDIQEAMWTAFGTSSSNATLPVALRVADERLGLRPEVSKFVLTVGATGNQNGTALYEGVVVLFLAQAFGVELSLGQQVTVVLMSILAGIGTAGVPGGSIPMIVVVMASVGVPAEGIGIILGLDRILDMCRTTLNVTGDLAIATCVDTMESRGAKVKETQNA
jgi:DAACS family dicarboxylate/amino acid:cation (Na+ or H+) symporter